MTIATAVTAARIRFLDGERGLLGVARVGSVRAGADSVEVDSIGMTEAVDGGMDEAGGT